MIRRYAMIKDFRNPTLINGSEGGFFKLFGIHGERRIKGI